MVIEYAYCVLGVVDYSVRMYSIAKSLNREGLRWNYWMKIVSSRLRESTVIYQQEVGLETLEEYSK